MRIKTLFIYAATTAVGMVVGPLAGQAQLTNPSSTTAVKSCVATITKATQASPLGQSTGSFAVNLDFQGTSVTTFSYTDYNPSITNCLSAESQAETYAGKFNCATINQNYGLNACP